MKNTIIIVLCFLFVSHSIYSQTNLIPLTNSDTLYVSDIKTTHLLFKENIKYVDVGSPFFVADTLQKMIRLKHTGEELIDIKSLQSNLTIITDKGSYYSMFLGFNRFAEHLNYEVIKSKQVIPDFKIQEDVQQKKEEIWSTLCDTITKLNSNADISNKSKDDLEIQITGIYYIDEKIAIRIQLTNDSGIDFDIDQIIFRSKLDKKFSADYLYQERIITPINICSNNFEVIGNSHKDISFLFNKFMLNKNENLYVDVFEQNGGRSATVCIPRKKLLKLKVL